MACDKYGLTTAQAAVSELLSSAWASLSSPTVIILNAPTGRGKTRIIQEFYDSQAEGQAKGRRFWRVRLAKDDLRTWRQGRKTVAPGPVDVTQRPAWLWFGLDGYPSGRVDFLGEIHRLNYAIVNGYESGKLPTGTTEPLRRGAGRGILSDLLKATTDVIADLLGGGLVKTGVETTLAVHRAVANRNELGVPLSVDDPLVAARAMLITSFVASLLGGLDRALAPTVLAVDDAHLLDSSAVATLDALMSADPENELWAPGLLGGKQREFAATRGIPPSAPVLLLATRQPLSDSQLDYFGARTDAWRKRGLAVITVGEDRLPLIPEDDAVAVAARRLADLGLDGDQLRLVAEQAHDRLLNGVNASLLIAHCERVWRLTDPHQTLTPEWAEQYLPRFIEEDARQRYDKLPLLAQKAVVAGSLRGPAFLQRSVAIILPELNQIDDWADEVHDSGYAERSVLLREEPQFVFSDEPSFAYARDQAVRDSALCTHALTTLSAPLLRNLWAAATVGPMGDGRALYEMSRQEAYNYRQLVEETNLHGETLDAEVWAATLGFDGQRQLILENDLGPSGPTQQLWSDLITGNEPLSGDGWAIASRWVIHRYLPGPYTFSSARTQDEGETRTWTRFHPRAPRMAALVASRVLPFLLAENRPLFEPGLRLLLRLGFAGRLLSSGLRRSVASRLLHVAPLRLSAAVILARVYGRDLEKDQREVLHGVLLAGPAPDPGDARTRRSLGLAWLGHELMRNDASQVIDDLLSACQTRPRFHEEDAFGITGRFLDVSDPLVYPWANQSIYAAAALLTAPRQIPIPADARHVASENLLKAVEDHPGAAWLMSSGKVPLTDQQGQRAKAAQATWAARGALDAGRFDLTGPIAVQPRTSKKKRRRR